MSLSVDNEEELFDDIAAALRVLRMAMDTKGATRIGDVRRLSIEAYTILKPWVKKEPS